LKVLDVGGGGGDNYFVARGALSDSITLKWAIWDSLRLFDQSEFLRSELGNSDNVWFFNEKENFSPELLLVNGTLQYLKDSNSLITDRLEKPKHVIIARTPFGNVRTDVNQHVTLLDEIIGQEENYFVECRIHVEEILVVEYGTLGYDLIWSSNRVPMVLRTDKGDIKAHYRTLFFTLRTEPDSD
jgi:putative methyltransferase (TIGR04325 family)